MWHQLLDFRFGVLAIFFLVALYVIAVQELTRKGGDDK
jgi:hypothetical protein